MISCGIVFTPKGSLNFIILHFSNYLQIETNFVCLFFNCSSEDLEILTMDGFTWMDFFKAIKRLKLT